MGKGLQFSMPLQKFGSMGEKTGWTYIEIRAEQAQALQPGTKTSFRVKGKLDDIPIKQMALIPMGAGNFILPVKSDLRKQLGKKKGDVVKIQLVADSSAFEINTDFMACLQDEPAALHHFQAMPGSHQRYFSKWIDSAKTEATRTKRIVKAVQALARQMNYAEMIRAREA
ncbi:MAG: YdeI/OmpD-associated family protein [Chitinophagales bacterium]